MIDIIFFLIALAALLVASYTDIRTREVPDWLNYGMIAAGLGVRMIYSLSASRWEYIIDGIVGLAVFYGFAYVMFYSGQWGGGDSKCLMGLGALLGLQFRLDSFALGVLVNTFLIGAAYGMVYSGVLAVIHRKAFMASWRLVRQAREFRIVRVALLFLVILGLVAGFVLDDLSIRFIVFALLLFLLVLFYAYLFTKAVETSCMRRWVKPEALTEGDWIVDDIVVAGKRICGPKDLGVSKAQIAVLVKLRQKGKLKRVLIKLGIPFVPSFLMALVVTWFVGNLFMPVIHLLQ